jgi:excisionase family DNA binding protein
MNKEKKALTPREAAQIYGLSEGTLNNLRYHKQGCRYYRVGRKVLYLATDFHAWITANPVLTKDSLPEELGRNR